MAASQFGEYEFVSRPMGGLAVVEIKGGYGRRIVVVRERISKSELLGLSAACLAAAREMD
jgi:hypothetical protein